MGHWLQTTGEFWSHFLDGIEAFSKTHAGLLVFLALAFGGVQALLAYLAIVKRKATSENFSQPLDSSVRLDLLTKIESEWVHDRLHQGLRNAIRVDLKLTETLAAVRPMLRIHTIAESGQPEERLIDEDILRIFKKANGRLLILGDPGTGKTNLLMELAEGLVVEAKSNRTLPIPIVFNLSRWTLGDGVRTLADWMIDDLADVTQYGLSRSTAGALVRQNLITPLLDGLDEVAEEYRADCAEAIHVYLQERDLGKLAICCRTTEYERLPRLYLRTAIRVEKLSPAEVERYISMDRLTHVRRALEGDLQLWKIIDTPLLLHVAVLAAEVEPSAGSESIPPRDRLYARFVNYALSRKQDDSPHKPTDTKLLKYWLGRLAAEMKRRDQTQFSFEGLDESWLPTKRAARWLVVLAGALFFGLIFFVATWLTGGLVISLASKWDGVVRGVLDSVMRGMLGGRLGGGLLADRPNWLDGPVGRLLVGLLNGLGGGLLGGLFVGLLNGLGDGLFGGRFVGLLTRERVIEELYFAWYKWREALTGRLLSFALIIGLSFGLYAGFYVALSVWLGVGPSGGGMISGVIGTVIGSLVFGVAIVLFNVLNVILQPKPVSGRHFPNRGTFRSLRYAVIVFLSGMALSIGVAAAVPGVLSYLLLGALLGFPAMLAFTKGGLFTISHYTVRLLLWRQGIAPLRYVRFLNEAAERVLLTRRGGSYEFFHVTFRDYMADTYGSKNLEDG